MSSCCGSSSKKGFQFDPVLHISSAIIILVLAASFLLTDIKWLASFASALIEFIGTLWWGILAGIVFVGIMNKIPREYFHYILGGPNSKTGILRATVAGVLFDLCSHGILMVGAKLYERGASFAQTVAFLVASPWNSISLTIILIALIGWQLTLLYILGSVIVALITGYIIQYLTQKGRIPANPNSLTTDPSFDFKSRATNDFKSIKWNFTFFKEIITGSKNELKVLLKWIMFGIIIAAAIRTFLPLEFFQTWFGPTIIGLFATLMATTLIEVCSEGSAPLASEFVHQAHAPGNGFTFLMAGVSTDYTEIMILKDTTKSWKMALILPLLTVPQIMVLGYALNFL